MFIDESCSPRRFQPINFRFTRTTKHQHTRNLHSSTQLFAVTSVASHFSAILSVTCDKVSQNSLVLVIVLYYLNGKFLDCIIRLLFCMKFSAYCLVKRKCDLSREKRKTTVFGWTAKAVGYPSEALMKALKALEKPLGIFFTYWRRWKKPLGNFSQTVGNVGKSRWVLFPYPLKVLRKAVAKIRPTRCYSAVNSLIYGSN